MISNMILKHTYFTVIQYVPYLIIIIINVIIIITMLCLISAHADAKGIMQLIRQVMEPVKHA